MQHFEQPQRATLADGNLQLRLDVLAQILKRDEDTDSCEEEDPDEIGLLIYSEWPKYVDGIEPASVILGPNGTTVNCADFDGINWTTTKKATRSLLALVFSDITLATHTPAGKRFSKKKLDPLKTDDIVHCVLVMCKGGSENAVRSVISNTCADTAKCYKVRNKKL